MAINTFYVYKIFFFARWTSDCYTTLTRLLAGYNLQTHLFLYPRYSCPVQYILCKSTKRKPITSSKILITQFTSPPLDTIICLLVSLLFVIPSQMFFSTIHSQFYIFMTVGLRLISLLFVFFFVPFTMIDQLALFSTSISILNCLIF